MNWGIRDMRSIQYFDSLLNVASVKGLGPENRRLHTYIYINIKDKEGLLVVEVGHSHSMSHRNPTKPKIQELKRWVLT